MLAARRLAASRASPRRTHERDAGDAGTVSPGMSLRSRRATRLALTAAAIAMTVTAMGLAAALAVAVSGAVAGAMPVAVTMTMAVCMTLAMPVAVARSGMAGLGLARLALRIA